MVREAVEVIDGRVPALDDVDGGLSGLPVGGNDEDGGGPLREHLLLPGQEEVPRRQRVVDRESRRPVGYEEGVHSHVTLNPLPSCVRDRR